MSKSDINVQDIIDIAPYLFQDEAGVETITEFECQSGWYGIIAQAISDIHKYLVENAEQLDEDVSEYYITSIKEKFGFLDIAFTYYDPQIDRICEKARMDSQSICEVSGKSGAQQYSQSGYVKTLHPSIVEEMEGKTA